MRILRDIEEEKEALRWFDEAATAAANSLCLRAKCGSVIVKNGKIIGKGFNSPPQNRTENRRCLNEYEIPGGFRHDRTCCIHAEQRAIEDAVRHGRDTSSARIYFVALDENGSKIKAKDLKCTICSRAVLDAGISEFALYCEDSVRVYDSVEFDRLSYAYKTPLVNESLQYK